MENREEAVTYINDCLIKYGCEPLSEKDLIDWDITGEETESKLHEMAHDFASEEHSNRCENKNSWRYEH